MSEWDYNYYDGTNDLPQFTQPGSLSNLNVPTQNTTSQFGNLGNNQAYLSQPSGYEANTGYTYTPGVSSPGYDQDSDFQSWLKKNSTGQLGVDNLFRLGGIGLTGLSVAGGLGAQKRAERAHRSALEAFDATRDPNAGFYQAELKRMLSDPNGYTTDIATRNKVKTLEEAFARQNARTGGAGQLNADQLRALQNASSQAYNERIKQLSELVGNADRTAAARGELMRAAPSADPLQVIAPGLAEIFRTGQDYAIDQGYASDPRLRQSGQARAMQQQQRAQMAQQFPQFPVVTYPTPV